LNIIIPVIFLTIALIQFGILLNSITFIKIYPNERAIKYWVVSLLSSSIGILGFAYGLISVKNLEKGSLFLTFANIIYFLSPIFLILYSKSIKKINTKINTKIYWIAVILFAIGFELVRKKGTFIDRQIYSAIAFSLAYFLVLLEIKNQKLYQGSKYLRIFSFTTLLEFILIIARISILLSNNFGIVENLNQIPILPLVMLWFVLVVNLWSYIAINGYWTERIASLNTENLIENTKIKALLNEKYKLINSLMTANKTAVSGALSASIAHEINQPLGAVKINSQHLDLLIKNKKEKKLIKSIIEDNDKAAKIISTLKSVFSNNTTYQIIEFDSFIESYKPFLIQAASEKKIFLKFHLDSSVSVKINSDQIRQVISNLFQNSIQALSRIEKKKKVIEIKTFIKNNKLIFLISDNGPGVDPKIKNKIFELYESSKNENIGLGLWLCKYIISLHKGTIKVNKQILKGAEFLIELPISYHA